MPKPTKVAEHRCSICNYKAPSSYKLRIHHSKHTGERALKCDYCSFGANKKGVLQKHIYKMHTNIEYRCTYTRKCKSSYPTEAELFDHIASEHPRRKYTCNICPLSYGTKFNLTYHMASKHGDKAQPRFSCSQCDKVFLLLNNLKQHQFFHTKTDDGHKCTECGEVFKSCEDIFKHSRQHEKAKLWRWNVGVVIFCVYHYYFFNIIMLNYLSNPKYESNCWIQKSKHSSKVLVLKILIASAEKFSCRNYMGKLLRMLKLKNADLPKWLCNAFRNF